MKKDTILPVLILILVLVASGTWIVCQTSESNIDHVTVRGERAVFQGNGLYRYDPAFLAREGIIWDVINLSIGVPLFAIAIILSRRNSLRGRLLLAGLLFYFFYVYLMYATMMAINDLFLVYVAIFALCPIAFTMNVQSIDVSRLPSQFSPRFPRRLLIGFTFALSAALIVLWMGRIIPILLDDQFPVELAGLTTLEGQALDLGMVVPLALSSGVLLWRRSAWGYLLTGVSLTYGLMMFISVPAWIIVPLIQDGEINPIEASPFLVLCLGGLILVGMFLRSVQQEGVV